MAGEGSHMKRKVSLEAPVSPPSGRRKLQSNTTRMCPCTISKKGADKGAENAIASFFTPSSQRPPEKVVWHECGRNEDSPNTLLVGAYREQESSATSAGVDQTGKPKVKIAAFDFVGG